MQTMWCIFAPESRQQQPIAVLRLCKSVVQLFLSVQVYRLALWRMLSHAERDGKSEWGLNRRVFKESLPEKRYSHNAVYSQVKE
jgi:hypothetical protein